MSFFNLCFRFTLPAFPSPKTPLRSDSLQNVSLNPPIIISYATLLRAHRTSSIQVAHVPKKILPGWQRARHQPPPRLANFGSITLPRNILFSAPQHYLPIIIIIVVFGAAATLLRHHHRSFPPPPPSSCYHYQLRSGSF